MRKTNMSNESFRIDIHTNGIASIRPIDIDSEYSIGFLGQSLLLVDQIYTLLQQEDIKAVLYYSIFPHSRFRYKRLFEDEQRHNDYAEKLRELLQKVELLRQQPKPFISFIDSYSTGLDLSIHLWAPYKIIYEDAYVSFYEPKYGIFPGFGAIRYTLSCMPLIDAYRFLTQGIYLSAKEVVDKGLFTLAISKYSDVIVAAEKLLQNPTPASSVPVQFTNEDQTLFDTLSAKTQKQTRGLVSGTNACLEIMASTLRPSQDIDPIRQEALLYQKVIADPRTKAVVRSGYYNSGDISRFALLADFECDRLGIIGAGMMGSGIAFEAAKAGMYVLLKDTSLEQAQRGKSHCERIASKLVEQGKMKESEKNAILRNIYPTEDYNDFKDLDIIIEAVFEDKELKKQVIREATSGLKKNGLMASNTTSLLISELAKESKSKENFAGIHFFSPVDRMQLIEIVRGKYTSGEAELKATKLANKLKKIPIVVNDGPGFFTSRVFFNYLLEAITMLLEGIPAKDIEEEAWKAGFGAGPLTVLDEISLPLMLHVYDQLPSLSLSQQRAYRYIKSLVDIGRSGRKKNKGFYNYEHNKTIWQDPDLPSLTNKEISLIKSSISKRLLNVMALDSYRCIDEGILRDPSDGDLGSTLGIGFPSYTGGVFSYIDQVGLPLFVKECESFADKGEQWDIPASLRQRAQEGYTFYKGFKSNWS